MVSPSRIASFKIDSYVKGYHEYQGIWVPKVNEKLRTRTEPENTVDKYAVLRVDNFPIRIKIKKILISFKSS